VTVPRSPVWHVVTGEYPPHVGGVGDYTALLAEGLAAAGGMVHVWTTPAGNWPGLTPDVSGVTVHRDLTSWSPRELRRLGSALDTFPAPRRVVVQHAPNVWGYKGLNLGFCRWVAGRKRLGDEVRVMFHEVAFPWEPRGHPKLWLLAAGQRWMARVLARGATHVDVSIPSWAAMLRACVPGDRRDYGVRPVPSNIPVIDDPASVAAARRRVAPTGELVVGSFGSFGDRVAAPLVEVLPRLLRGRPDRVGLLIGHKGDRVAARVAEAHPELADRLVATGSLSASEASRYLQICDIMLQPYPDGVSGRRGSLMAALGHGIPTATNAAWNTEAYWSESGGVALAPSPGAELVAAAEGLIADPERRRLVGAAGRDLHDRRFVIGRTVEAILASTSFPGGTA
jgi:glycosyltransferase involved in cell wall biosynthesis